MLKKTFFFCFIILCINLFSRDFSVKITNEIGIPIDNAYVSLGELIKKSDKNGYAEFSIEENIVSLFIEKSPYKSQTVTVNTLKDNKIEIALKDAYDFYINIYEASDYKYEFNQSSLNKYTIKDSIINIYKNGEMISSYDYYGRDLGMDLKKGDYTVVVYSLFSSPYIIENVKFDTKKAQYLNIELPVKTYNISGIISSTQTLLGGAEISFRDKNRIFNTTSLIDGTYSIRLPSGVYTQIINKLGYETLEKTVNITNELDNLSYNLPEIPSTLKGRILDSKGNPVTNKDISIKNNERNIVVTTDNKGYYEAKVYSGLAFLKIDISGFFPTGKVERIDSLSTKELSDIRLTERIATLTGTITNGILPIAGVSVKLYDEKESYYGMSITDSKGFFNFPEIKSGIKYFLLVDNPNYTLYKSELFLPEDNKNQNFSIILNNNDLSFILELKTNVKSYDYSSLSVYINNIKFQADKNGIINETIKSLKDIESLNIEIPKLNIKKTYKLSELGSEPHLILINF